ncbi:MAG: flagellar biosynthetic protein FliR [Vampirovibrionales bacterium]|nr:flagellar biosynthetic protein FliR [Vampirovibrionales bacterium]
MAVAASFDLMMQGMTRLLAQHGASLDHGLLVFARVLAFLVMAPVFNRRDIPFNVKLSFGVMLTCMLLWIIPIDTAHSPMQWAQKGNMGPFVLLLAVNATVGALLGFIADMILRAVYAAGSLMNNQIGLSSAMIFDPSSRAQVMLLERLFGFLATLGFLYIGGAYWLILALKRSFDVFPLLAMNPDIVGRINLEYLVTVSGNVLHIGTILAAPILVVTLAIDVILGIVNRTAQQIPVFQLSFALKPCIGVAVFLATLPLFMQAMMNFLMEYASFF